MRVFLGAFGQPGHAFPMLALGTELAARGHQLTYETWSRWRAVVEEGGMSFVPAPESNFSDPMSPLGPYDSVAPATTETCRAVAEAAPDVVVHDILTLAPALAGELAGVPVATLVPHVYPIGQPGFPPYAFGARMPRTSMGRTLWRVLDRPVHVALEKGRTELNGARRRVGLPELPFLHGGLSRQLTMVGTLPQLEYPREWPQWAHVVGPLLWEPACARVDPPEGDAPLVVVAPSTAQDPAHRLLRAAVEGLRDEPVRVLATQNRRPLPGPIRLGANTRLVDWVSYARTMPACDLVICHAGHGTLARALASGCPVLAVPHVGDMAENAARVDWAGAGVRLPWPLLSPRTLRLATQLALSRAELRTRAQGLAAWVAEHPGAPRAADLVERLGAVKHAGAPPCQLGGLTEGRRNSFARDAANQKKLRGWDSNPQPNG